MEAEECLEIIKKILSEGGCIGLIADPPLGRVPARLQVVLGGVLTLDCCRRYYRFDHTDEGSDTLEEAMEKALEKHGRVLAWVHLERGGSPPKGYSVAGGGGLEVQGIAVWPWMEKSPMTRTRKVQAALKSVTTPCLSMPQ